MVLLETKNSLQSLNSLTFETRLSNMTDVDSDGACKEIFLLWSDEVDLSIRLISTFFIELEVTNSATRLL